MTPTTSVIVLTEDRPDLASACLTHLMDLRHRPEEIIVADGSASNETAHLVESEFPTVRVVRCDGSPGARRRARHRALEFARGEVVAFLDDDIRVDPGWLTGLIEPYVHPDVVGVGGPVVTARHVGRAVAIGRLLPDGRLTAEFDGEPDRDVRVDYLPSSNMSFRREALARCGGWDDVFPGTGIREDADLCFRVRAATGHQLIFTPAALVRHESVHPQVGGRRFRRGYFRYFARRNHLDLLVRHCGVRDPRVRNYLRVVLGEQRLNLYAAASVLGPRTTAGARRPITRRLSAPVLVAHIPVELAGTLAGLRAGVTHRRRSSTKQTVNAPRIFPNAGSRDRRRRRRKMPTGAC